MKTATATASSHNIIVNKMPTHRNAGGSSNGMNFSIIRQMVVIPASNVPIKQAAPASPITCAYFIAIPFPNQVHGHPKSDSGRTAASTGANFEPYEGPMGGVEKGPDLRHIVPASAPDASIIGLARFL